MRSHGILQPARERRPRQKASFSATPQLPHWNLFHAGTGLDVAATFELDGQSPELVIELSAQGEMPASIQFPRPFLGQPGDYLVVPMNEGISYPVNPQRRSKPEMRLGG